MNITSWNLTGLPQLCTELGCMKNIIENIFSTAKKVSLCIDIIGITIGIREFHRIGTTLYF